MAETASLFHLEDILLVAIHNDIDDSEIVELQERLGQIVERDRVRGVVIDIAELEIVDTFIGRVLGQLARIAKLLSAQTYVVGMRPAVAMTLAELGMTLPELRTALNVTQALRRLRQPQ